MLAKGHRNATTIDNLSDNVLIEIFDRFRERDDQYNQAPFCVWKWHLLVRVSRRWRQIIFASPRRLDLQLLCTNGTSFRKIIDIWHTIPIVVYWQIGSPGVVEDDIIPALEHPDRVSHIYLFLYKPKLEAIAAFIQKPFPMLTHLSVFSPYGSLISVLPDGFLGGSAPSLQQLALCAVRYPALPVLLLSASNLVNLELLDMPPTGYISTEVMVSLLAASHKLETLHIEFGLLGARPSSPDIIVSPPVTRAILPALCDLSLIAGRKYIEDFLSRIDTPRLNSLLVNYKRGVRRWEIDINYDVPQLSKFINRSESLKRSLSKHCEIKETALQCRAIITFCVGRTTSERWNPNPGISVCLGRGIEEPILRLANILGFITPILSDIVHCTIDSVHMVESGSGRDDLDWLQLLRQLSYVQTLFVSDDMAGLISRALAHVDVGTITQTLPALQLLCIEIKEDGEEHRNTSSVHKFLTVRQDAGHPVTFVETKDEFEERLKSYQ